jgi:hypothetical protein
MINYLVVYINITVSTLLASCLFVIPELAKESEHSPGSFHLHAFNIVTTVTSN